MFKDEKIYIAGPECFYTGGCEMLGAMRKYAESKGFGVTLPNDHPLDMGSAEAGGQYFRGFKGHYAGYYRGDRGFRGVPGF